MNRFLWLSMLGMLLPHLRSLSGVASPLSTNTKASFYQASHTVTADDPVAAAAVANAGGHLIASYGGKHLFDLPTATSNVLAIPGIELRDDYQSIFLNSGLFGKANIDVNARANYLKKNGIKSRGMTVFCQGTTLSSLLSDKNTILVGLRADQ